MLKGSYTTIIVSILLHLLLLFALIQSSSNSPRVLKENKPKITSIKSFLYSAPKKVASQKVVPKKSVIENVMTKTALPPKTEVKEVVTSKESKKKSTVPVQSTVVTKVLPVQVTNAVKSDTVTTKNKVAGVSQSSLSGYDRLSRLRKNLESQQRDKAFAELTQTRSASSMDGEPFPVPSSLVPLTVDQQYKLNTSSSHVGSITKNDNGTCTIQREQILGSPVEATTSYFACGESKFDKSFRQHMEKVQAKFSTK